MANRLTQQTMGINPNRKYFYKNADDTLNELNKLGALEDIEEELGVSLITLFKALKQQWVYDIEEKHEMFINKLLRVENYFVIKAYQKDYKLSAYGKTWALTKEELQ